MQAARYPCHRNLNHGQDIHVGHQGDACVSRCHENKLIEGGGGHIRMRVYRLPPVSFYRHYEIYYAEIASGTNRKIGING